jgi:hypothetical protein
MSIRKQIVVIGAVLAGLATAGVAAAKYTWWAPSGDACPTYSDQASCEKSAGKGCTQRSGTALPAC